MAAIVNGGTFYIGGGASSGGSSLNYSTEEQIVGTWIDGRPVYQKSYFKMPGIGATELIDAEIKHGTHTLVNIQGAWAIGGFEYINDEVTQASIFDKSSINNYTEVEPPSIYIDKDGLYVKPRNTSFGYEIQITILYTKTTD